MPLLGSRDTSILAGAQSQTAQFSVSLVLFTIPSFSFNALNTSDVDLYLNTSTNVGAMAAGAGLTKFAPYPMTVPKIGTNAKSILTDVSLTVANITDGAGAKPWSVVVAANAYSDTVVTIWEGNIVLAPGAAPTAATFAGAVLVWSGRIDDITPGTREATITLAPHAVTMSMQFPYRIYSAPEFKHLPSANLTLPWGIDGDVDAGGR